MANLASKGAGSKAKAVWQDEELKEFYDQYHKVGNDAGQLAAVLPGHTADECEELVQQFQTFLSLPHSHALQTAFVGMVKDFGNSTSDDAAPNGLMAAAAVMAAAAASIAAEQRALADSEPAAAAAAAADDDPPDEHEDRPPFSPGSHQQQLPFSPSQHKTSSLAHRLAVELNCLSQGHSQQSPGAAHYDTGDDEGEQQGGGGGVGSQGGRPQRTRKPKQYLGEPVSTPRGGRGGSLPSTPGSSTRRRLARANSGQAATREATGRRRPAGVSAFYGAAASPAHYPDSSSAKKRRHRRLFEELHAQGMSEATEEYYQQDEAAAVGLEDLAHHAASQGAYGTAGSYGYGSGWDEEGHGQVDDDVEEGVDALLSLASMAHASSSCQTDSQHQAGEEPGDYYHSQQQHAGGSGRSRRRPKRSASRLQSVDEHGEHGEDAGEGGQDEQQEQQQQDSQGGEGYDSDNDAAEDAADGLASMRAHGGSQGWGTPKRPIGGDFGIFRTGTPGGVGRASEFLLASPGVSDKPSNAFPLPLPSPSGRRGKPLYGAAAASAAAAAAAGGPKSPGGRGRGRGRGGRRGRGRGGARGGSKAAGSGGSSGQRGGSAGPLQEAGYSGDATGAAVGGSEADADEDEPELMDAAELAATVSTGPGLSSPHTRTHSASEPPRSAVLLGKRGAADDAEDTPASHRSVRQRVDASQHLTIPQPLFSGGGAGAAAAGELAELASDMQAGATGADQHQGRKSKSSKKGAVAAEEEEQAEAGRGTRSGRAKRKQQAARNLRKPRKEGRSQYGTRGHHVRDDYLYAPAELTLRRMVGSSRVQRWIRYEWHYSAVDRPYFMRNEMQDLLDGLGLRHVTHLTRGEWSVIRSAVGKPRRLSMNFLKQERHKLEAYRERVRAAYEAAGIGMEVPADLPRPLKVAQPVVARHPGTRSLHDGIILTIKSNKYRVQFNRSELMTEVVRDIDVMPIDPSENLPLTGLMSMPQLLNGRPAPGAAAAALTSAAAQAALARRRQLQAAAAAAAAVAQVSHAGAAAAAVNAMPQMQIGGLSGSIGGVSGAVQLQRQPTAVGDDPSKTDQQLLAELSSVLDRKEGLLSKLRAMNSTAEEGKHLDAATNRPAEAFQNSYASVLSNLQSINSELQGLLARLQHRPHLAALKPPGVSAGATAAAAVPAAAAAAGAAAASGGAVAGGGSSSSAGAAVPASDAAALPATSTLISRGSSSAVDVAAAAAAAATSVPVSAAAAAAAELSPAAALVQGATAEALSIVQRLRAQQPDAGSESVAADTAAAAAREGSRLDDIIAGCVSMLVTVHKLTSPPGTGDLQQQQQQLLGTAGIEAALEAAVQQLKPKAAANQQAFADIVSSVTRLKAQLMHAH